MTLTGEMITGYPFIRGVKGEQKAFTAVDNADLACRSIFSLAKERIHCSLMLDLAPQQVCNPKVPKYTKGISRA